MNAKAGSLPLPEIDIEEFRKVVRTRRSIRRFTDEPIPETVLDDCLELATLAPNSSNLQPWEFFVVRTPELKEKLAHACLGQNAAKTAAALIVVVARPDTWRAHARQRWRTGRKKNRPSLKSTTANRPHSLQPGPFGILGLAKKAAGLAVESPDLYFRAPTPPGK